MTLPPVQRGWLDEKSNLDDEVTRAVDRVMEQRRQSRRRSELGLSSQRI